MITVTAGDTAPMFVWIALSLFMGVAVVAMVLFGLVMWKDFRDD